LAGIEDMLKGLDAKSLEMGMKSAKQFAATAEGKAMINKFKNKLPNDKEKLMQTLSENPEIIKSIEKFLNL